MPPARKPARSPAPPESLATPEEVAAYFKHPSTATLKHWRRVGYGPPFTTVGKHVLYDWSDVTAWFEAEKAKGQRAADSKRPAA